MCITSLEHDMITYRITRDLFQSIDHKIEIFLADRFIIFKCRRHGNKYKQVFVAIWSNRCISFRRTTDVELRSGRPFWIFIDLPGMKSKLFVKEKGMMKKVSYLFISTDVE